MLKLGGVKVTPKEYAADAVSTALETLAWNLRRGEGNSNFNSMTEAEKEKVIHFIGKFCAPVDNYLTGRGWDFGMREWEK